jgi:hypothetical protein
LPSPLLKIISVATAMQRIFQERREQKRQVKKHVLFNSRPLVVTLISQVDKQPQKSQRSSPKPSK